MTLMSLLRMPLGIAAIVTALLSVSPTFAQSCEEPVAQPEPAKPTTSAIPGS